MNNGVKVLVTDDDPDILALTSALLRDEGYEVIEASTGEQCLKEARRHHPDLILLDVMLPDMQGTEICRQVKTDADLADSLVILLSGIQISPEFQAEGLNAGADGYMTKPFFTQEFLARVHAMVRIKRAEDALRHKEQEQQKLIADLEEALGHIKTLKGFIPICAHCKDIRDEEGHWNRVEVYVTNHTDAVFTHGICPHCAEKFKAEMDELFGEDRAEARHPTRT